MRSARIAARPIEKAEKSPGREIAQGSGAGLINPQGFFINGERVHAQVFRAVRSHFLPHMDDVHPAALAFTGTVADARFPDDDGVGRPWRQPPW